MKDYLKLLAKRESKAVLGRRWATLWMLVVVLTATFVSIAFSNGSLAYLKEKMEDPFTNWVNIENDYRNGRFNEFRRALANQQMMERYGYKESQADSYDNFHFLNIDGLPFYLEGRFFESMNTDLMRAVLSSDNIAFASLPVPADIDDESIGLILAESTVKKLGFDESTLPAYLSLLFAAQKADTLGFEMFDDNFASVPIPILAVVKRLPMNMEIVASKYFREQAWNDVSHPFNLNHESYARSLYYYVERMNVAQFKAKVDSIITDCQVDCVVEDFRDNLAPSKKGSMIRVYLKDELSIETLKYAEINTRILSSFAPTEVTRIYNYDFSGKSMDSGIINFISVAFSNLSQIHEFEMWAKEDYQIQIEMSQVNSKENFHSVSRMAYILSGAMFIFAIVCIILFIFNTLQSYFQKVKHNLGTFKAFGISNESLIGVYVVIFSVITITATLISLLISWMIELMLPFWGIVQDVHYSYLLLWQPLTMGAVIIVISASIATVWLVMRRLLKTTPGDLIYDR